MQPFVTRRVTIPVTENRPVGETATPLRRVLFVSADAELRAAVTRVLEDEHYIVQAVAHSGHALLLCRTMEFDVVVAELSGPDLSGPSLVEQLRRHCPRLSAIFLGNPGTPEDIEHVLVRPFTREDLLERLHVALHALAA
jgi:DNA-binding response OmpR family regulator